MRYCITLNSGDFSYEINFSKLEISYNIGNFYTFIFSQLEILFNTDNFRNEIKLFIK